MTLQVSGPDGPYTIETRYLIGADGGHSIVRKLAGIAFPGVTTDETIARTAHAVVPAELVDPVTGRLDIPGYGPIPPFLHHRTERGLFVYAALPGAPAPLMYLLGKVAGMRRNPHAGPADDARPYPTARETINSCPGSDL